MRLTQASTPNGSCVGRLRLVRSVGVVYRKEHHDPPLYALAHSVAAIALMASLAVTAVARAQPTGNPKGTVTPPETSAPKAGVAPRPKQADMSGADGGKLVGNEAQTRARIQSGRPSSSGTEGGLSSKRQGVAAGNAGNPSNTGSVRARPVPPSR
jgi:hypothetical protein